MSTMTSKIEQICARYDHDRARLMDIVREVQEAFDHVPREAFGLIAEHAGTHRVEVESVVSFYSFLSDKKQGDVVIRLCDDIIDRFQGGDEVGETLCKALNINFDETTADGNITLEKTACIGMSDQAPAMMVNDTVITNLTPEKIPAIIEQLKANPDPQTLITEVGDGNNADPLVQAMVKNNICEAGPVILSDYRKDAGLRKTLTMTPEEVIEDVKTSGLRGRGGAGFLTGLKWALTRSSPGTDKYVLCNADEGEPGTFKDRVLLTERADLVLEGMTIAAYAIGAETGIIYLRAEYAYLRAFLEDKMNQRRAANLLGNNILGKEGFNFDVRIQMGAGAYVCGEETSLISSCEGTRGDPTDRTPFPVVKGYMVSPTAVNNVESYC
ncbi:MAG: NAD(P)H-dependent oxidoreductase subunit E, partial [Pontiella sp.]|nr:NAD(P)H-dependent oxidoreductase subunit E [Pontiella sp.]